MPQLGSKSHSQVHTSQSKAFFSLGEEEKKALFPHTFSPEAPWAGAGPGASEPLMLFCHHPRGWLRTPPARRGQDLSIYIQPLGCRREGSTLDLTLPLLGVGDRSAMNHTANSSPQPLPTGVWRAAFRCQLQLSQSRERLCLVTLRSCCQALQGVVLGLPWSVPHLPIRSWAFGVPPAQLSQFRDEKSSNGSLGWASRSQSYLQRQRRRMGEQSQGDSRVIAKEGAHQTKKQTSYFTFPPACLHQNPSSQGHFTTHI